MSKANLTFMAETLGLSVGTVSKALNGYKDVSEKTRQKVLDLAEKLKYSPNSYALSLRNQESKTIGLLVPEIVHHFFSNIIHGVVQTAEAHGYVVIILESDESYDVEKKQLQLLLDRNVDGILMSLADNTVNYKHISGIINGGTPITFYDKITKSIETNKVLINDEKAAYNATKHLINTGCKRIAHIRGALKPQTTIDRLKGYRKAIEESGLVYDKTIVFESENFSFEDGKKIAKRIAEDFQDIDGVFAFTDLTATGLLVGLKDRGYKIPEDISIIGFSNWFLTKITTPKLTTVNQSGYEMGKQALMLLLKEIEDRKNKIEVIYKTIEIPADLVIRDSTKKLGSSQ